MIRAVLAAVAVLVLSAATAFALQSNPGVEVAVDVVSDGNTATSIGPMDSCRSVNVGDTFDIDLTIKGIEPLVIPSENYTAPGLAGFEYNFHFDPSVVHVVGIENNFVLKPLSEFEWIAANWVPNGDPNPLPATTGDMRVTYLDASEDFETGDGVLSRLTLQAVGAGTATLYLDSEPEQEPAPAIYAAGGIAYNVSSLSNAVVTVGGSCSTVPVPTPFDPPDTWDKDYAGGSGTPTPTPGPPTPSPTLGPEDTDEGDTAVAVDAIPTGNSATTVAQIDDCASAIVGQTFPVDIVVENVHDLLAWEAAVTYNPNYLKIVGHDVKQFLAGNAGSSVFDASNQTPNTTGFYRAGAVDQADPAAPDSGSGVLIRMTLEAIGEGVSLVSITPVDQTNDGQPDTGVLLKNVENKRIGGAIFRGQTSNAEIRVGSACESGAEVVQASAPPQNGESEDDGDSGTFWIVIGIGAVLATLAGGAGTLYMLRRRNQAGTPDGGTPV